MGHGWLEYIRMRSRPYDCLLTINMGLEQNQININKEQSQAGKFARELECSEQKDQAKLYKSCWELESFLNQILQSMRNTIPKSDFTGHSYATDWESMLFEEYAKEISKQLHRSGGYNNVSSVKNFEAASTAVLNADKGFAGNFLQRSIFFT